MAGFYARRLKIFGEAEAEPDAVATPNVDDQTAQNPDANQDRNTNQDNPEAGEYPQEGRDTPPDDGATLEPPDDPVDDQGTDAPPADDIGGDAEVEDEAEVDPIKHQEEEIYANLTPEQLDIKHKELKDQFLHMFDMTTDIVKRIGNLSVDSKDVSTIEYVSNKLSKLREMLTDYINSVYRTKSYTENSINYNRFLATLHGINKILEEIPKK